VQRAYPLRRSLLIAAFVATLIAALVGGVARGQGAQPQGEATFDWRSDWAVADGYTIVKDTSGYNLPAAIAFVPEPGSGPKDPLYFVTELRGQLKVVTNDRSVYTFAENFLKFTPEEELPSGRGQGGEAGLCLDPTNGYIFVTFLYNDAGGTLRNNMVRYSSTPGTFGLQPSGELAFTELFAKYEAGLAHHIGACQVVGDELFVGVGESWQPHLAQDPTQMVGKIYRMSLDGKPLADNPFYEDEDVTKAQNYVWATGFRNPYGLKVVDGRLFVGDNGLGTDRFVEVIKGEDYGWNGVESSIHMKASYLWVPSLGPTQLQYLPADSTALSPEWRDGFFLGMTGSVRRAKWPGIQYIPFDMQSGELRDVPSYFLRFRGTQEQMLVGVAFGPDGLYFLGTYPNQDGETPVYKIVADPSNSYPYKPTKTDDPMVLIREKGCLGCHRIGANGGFGGAAGPALDQAALIERVKLRLESEPYRKSFADLDQLADEPWASTRAARAAVLAAESDEAVRLWVVNQIMEPRWDDRGSQMPNMGVTPQEAELIASHLLAAPAGEPSGLWAMLPKSLQSRTAWAMFGGGIVLGAGLLGAGLFIRSQLRRRATPHA
jgi:Glucose / Sorbosone dehydrogenase